MMNTAVVVHPFSCHSAVRGTTAVVVQPELDRAHMLHMASVDSWHIRTTPMAKPRGVLGTAVVLGYAEVHGSDHGSLHSAI